MVGSRVVETPLGVVLLVAEGNRLCRIGLPGAAAVEDAAATEKPCSAQEKAVLDHAEKQLIEYFEGQRDRFDIPVSMDGTSFQRDVWNALQDIPYGETRSYGDIAAAIGRPGAARAVGQANRNNSLPIIVPCHRVVASDGGLGGYMGAWGDNKELGLKARLLRLEGAWMS